MHCTPLDAMASLLCKWKAVLQQQQLCLVYFACISRSDESGAENFGNQHQSCLSRQWSSTQMAFLMKTHMMTVPLGVPLIYELADDLTPIRHYYLV